MRAEKDPSGTSEQIIGNVYVAGGNDRLPRWWFSVPQQPKPHSKFSTFPTFTRNPSSTPIPFPSYIYNLIRRLSLCRTRSPCRCDEMSTAVLPLARRPRPAHSRGSKRPRSIAAPPASSVVAERVPEFQKCAKLPRKLPKLVNPPREVDYSIIEQHAPDICKSGTPLSYVRDALAIRGPLCVSVCFLFRWNEYMRHAMLTSGDISNHIGYMIVQTLVRNSTP